LKKNSTVAVVVIEELAPFPEALLGNILKKANA
jgi:hypothetical protein